MARKKSASRSRKKSPPVRERIGGAVADLRDRWVSGPGPLIVTVIVIAAIAITTVLSVPALERRVASANSIEPADMSITFVAVPEWVAPDITGELEDLARRELTGDPLEQTELVAVSDALMASGWLESVEQVRRRRIDAIEIGATFRSAFALVRDGGTDYLVDRQGHRLPREFPARTDRTFVVIDGAARNVPGAAGAPWRGRDVEDALTLLAMLVDRPWYDQIESIDVADYATDGILTLVTDIGSRIVWGSAPGAERPLEMTASVKLSYLDRAYEESGTDRIDFNQQGRWHFLADSLTSES